KLVCAHWLKGLCKKNDQCEYLHEFNMRRMQDCSHYQEYGVCTGRKECYLQHIDKETVCESYKLGFCYMGPYCKFKHVHCKLCPRYLNGFCPLGDECTEGEH
ncbi:hypothetical protein HANVADRAFT_11458, partial [Hanseniaspora valbyensis NRRL Y-1626]